MSSTHMEGIFDIIYLDVSRSVYLVLAISMNWEISA